MDSPKAEPVVQVIRGVAGLVVAISGVFAFMMYKPAPQSTRANTITPIAAPASLEPSPAGIDHQDAPVDSIGF